MDWQLAGIICAIVLAGWFAGAETVFLSFNKARLHAWRRAGVPGAERVWFLTEKPERYVGTTLIGTNLLAVIYSSLAAVWLESHRVPPIYIFTLPPLALLVLAEIVPKVIGRQLADRIILAVGWGLAWSRRLLYPAVALVEAGFSWVRRRWELGDSSVNLVLSRAEIATALDEAGSGGAISMASHTLVQRFFRLSELRVSDVMTPRTAIVGVPEGTPVGEARRRMITSGYSRLPVYRGSLDDIVGVVFAREMLSSPADLPEITRPLPMAPESMRVIKLLPWMRRQRASLAGVVDEFGGLAGIVGLDDLAQELVGPILDEYDSDAAECLQVTRRVWLAPGSARLSFISHRMGLDIHGVRARSLGGLVVELAGGIPRSGVEIRLSGAMMRVIRASARGVDLVRITLEDGAEGGEHLEKAGEKI